MAEMKIPGPDHPIEIAYNPRRVRALYQGHLVADTAAALTLSEASYRPVQYFPRENVEMSFLSRTDHHSFCPYKGEASYYSIVMDGKIAENAVWTYEDPYPAMALIRGFLAFYPDKVEIYELEEEVRPAVIAEVVEHTDSGSGQSQREHWRPNVSEPAPDLAAPFRDTGAI
jgi:uncharacterized protein (DUF427 family)